MKSKINPVRNLIKTSEVKIEKSTNMKKQISNGVKKLIPLSIGFLPMLAMAVSIENDIIKKIIEIFNAIIPLLMVVATVFFLWGVLQFVTSGGDEEKRKEGRDHIIYGLIGLFIMVAVWGLVGAISGTFTGLEGKGIPKGPEQQGQQGGSI